MKTADYLLEEISRTLKPYVYVLLLVGSLIALIGAFLLYIDDGFSNHFIYYDISAFVILQGLLLFRKHLHLMNTVRVIIITLMILSITIIYRSAFVGNGIYLLLIAMLFSIIFWSQGMTYLLFFIGLSTAIVVLIQQSTGSLLTERIATDINDPKIFLHHIMGFVILSMAMLLFIVSIRKILTKNINRLESLVLDLEEKNEAIKDMAYINQLTGLPNRHAFKKTLNDSLDAKAHKTLLMVDIRDFNDINSFYGTDMGDEVLQGIGHYFHDNLGDVAYSAYIGSNSYAILYNGVLERSLLENRVKHTEFMINNISTFTFPLSAHKVCIPDIYGYSDFDELNAVTTHLMQTSKIMNNDLLLYYDEKDSFVMESTMLQKQVRRAMAEDLFTVYFQEKVDSRSRQVVGLEALARLWIDDQFIPPSKFIPVIENNNLSIDFGWLIIQLVMEAYKDIETQYYEDIIVSINITTELLSSEQFVPKLRKMIHSYGLNPKHIELEITESMIIKNFEQVRHIISELQYIGIRVSIDDFGTGYSSLQYISNLTIDVVKIDKSFIDVFETNPVTRTIVQAIIDIADAAEIEVVAEGVELEAQSKLLAQMGCYNIQGYLYHRPAPIEKH